MPGQGQAGFHQDLHRLFWHPPGLGQVRVLLHSGPFRVWVPCWLSPRQSQAQVRGPALGPSSDSACPKSHAPHPSSALCGPYSQGCTVGSALGPPQLPPDHRPRKEQPTGRTAGPPLSHTGPPLTAGPPLSHSRTPLSLSHRGSEAWGGCHSAGVSESGGAARDRRERRERRGQRDRGGRGRRGRRDGGDRDRGRQVRRPTKEKQRHQERKRQKGP